MRFRHPDTSRTVDVPDTNSQLQRYYRDEGWDEVSDTPPAVVDAEVDGEPVGDPSDLDETGPEHAGPDDNDAEDDDNADEPEDDEAGDTDLDLG